MPSRFAHIRELKAKYLPIEMYPEAADTWTDDRGVMYENSVYAPVWRWRQVITNDFQAGMDWCVQDYSNANHPPVAVIFGDRNRTILRLTASEGETLELDASDSYDPDGDELIYKWYEYPGARTYEGRGFVEKASTPICVLKIPGDCSGKQIHIILELTDRNKIVNLTSYRRVVIDVQ